MKREERIAVLLTLSERQAARRIAEKDGEPVSVLVRRLLRTEARRRGLWPRERGNK